MDPLAIKDKGTTEDLDPLANKDKSTVEDLDSLVQDTTEDDEKDIEKVKNVKGKA